MFPSDALANRANGRPSNRIIGGEFLIRSFALSISFSYFQDLLSSKKGAAGLFTLHVRICTVLVSMAHVLSASYPFKVLDTIIRLVKVLMIDLVSWWTRATKKSKNKRSNGPGFMDGIFSKGNSLIARTRLGGFQDVGPSIVSVMASYPTLVANLIQAFIIRNRFPAFSHWCILSDIDIIRIHQKQQFVKCVYCNVA